MNNSLLHALPRLVRTYPCTTLIVSAAVITRTVLAWHSGFSPYQGFNEAFYALGSQQLQSDLIPRINGAPHWNTPPLYVWFLTMWGNVFGWSELSLRLPSILAWVLTAPAIARLHNHFRGPAKVHFSVLLWFILPFPFLWAGRAQTDMMVTMFIAWAIVYALRQEHFKLTVTSGLGLLTKQVALLPVALFLRQPRTVIAYLTLPAVFGLVFYVWGEQPNFVAHQGLHLGLRGLGFWEGRELLAHGILVGTALLPLLIDPFQRWKPNRLWGMVALFLLFTLYAAPPGHTYYFLPAYVGLAVLLPAVFTTKNRTRLAVAACVLFSAYAVWDSGDLWDTRIRDATDQYGAMQGVDTGIWAHHQYYTGQPTAHLSTGTVVQGLNLVFAYPPECVVVQTYPGLFGVHRPLLVVACHG